MYKRQECEVIVTGEEDVVEYSYDTEYAKYLFDEVNKMRTANGVEPFVWNEEDAVYASKVKVGMHVQPDFDIYGIIGVDENEETQDVQLVYGDDKLSLIHIYITAVGVVIIFYLAMVSAVAYTLWSVLLAWNDVSKVAIFGFVNPL